MGPSLGPKRDRPTSSAISTRIAGEAGKPVLVSFESHLTSVFCSVPERFCRLSWEPEHEMCPARRFRKVDYGTVALMNWPPFSWILDNAACSPASLYTRLTRADASIVAMTSIGSGRVEVRT